MTTNAFQIGLAPMEGVTELATRLWFQLVAAPRSMTTPFLRVTPGFPYKRIDQTFFPEMKRNTPGRYTLVPQLMASDAADAMRIMEPILEDTPFVEMNCGCPAPKVVGHGAGSGLLTTPLIFLKFTEALVEKFPGRVAIKMRLGLSCDEEFFSLFDVIKHMPLARLTIHGRTRENRYTGKARWWPMEHAAAAAPFPVIGSGDIVDQKSFFAARQEAPSLAGVIIGRGALRNPWVFQEIETGRPVEITPETLYHALFVYACLQELAFLKPTVLLDYLAHDMLNGTHGTAADRWEQAADFFQNLLKTELGEGHVISRGTLARIKMLWNYLRSSLPPAFFEPQLFRIAQTQEFLLAIRHLAKNCDIHSFVLEHRSEMDWVYAGEK